MSDLIAEKIEQASSLVAESPFDAWIVFVRETSESSDPVLPFILHGSLTWQSALIFGKNGRRIAVVGGGDAEALMAAGHWDVVSAYIQDIKPPLLKALESVCGPNPKLGVNFSTNDEKCDGLSHGMYLLLEGYLKGTRFEGSLESAESVCMALRGRKAGQEIHRMLLAIAAGDLLFQEIGRFARVGVSEREIYDFVHSRMAAEKLGFSWDPAGDPIVNSGPNSMVGHGIPSETIRLEPGHVFHIDLGVVKDGYSSDVQRCWYVGDEVPADVMHGFDAVRAAILAGHELLTPGVQGWMVDAAARKTLVAAGYDEYMHGFGHQVGRVAHDGGALLGPKWERYGDRPLIPIAEGETYTLELGVTLPGRGYLGLEEMVQVTADGCKWLSQPQTEMWLIIP